MMDARPTLTTARLVLRPFRSDDAAVITELAGAREVAATTIMIPHPYPEGAAAAFIAKQADDFRERRNVGFAIVERETDRLVGAVGITLAMDHRCGEIGYWIGVPYWGRGYATEAAQAVLDYGFDTLDLNRIEAHHLVNNPSSGRVLEKIGMTLEGRMRQKVCKWGEFLDTLHYALLREERGTSSADGA